ncbi:ABC transporter permease [Modestobacter sp. VKM Ac-2978]|uniref:ABC transporter permease n=1 Tax=Modestobacter sp. VKM Ac-2978 TaxID=3004132 RepID=UPI0022AA19DA|nr:ABC transporter permease [Modestobacter sp. VKM Ac-2978]MCZ2847814.1 ABC transporter permease [Modestobacter sp. VKM Ac-2978]
MTTTSQPGARPAGAATPDQAAPKTAERAARRRLSDLPGWALSLMLAVFAVAVWQAVVVAFDVSPIIFPAPTAVAESLYSGLADGSLVRNGWVTLKEIFLGFGVAVVTALGVAFLVTQSRLVDKAVYPLVVATQTIPKVAIAPVLIIWFGTGLTSKVVTTALLAFFPLLVNAIHGLRSTDPDQIAMFRAFGATRSQVFRRLQFPSALPSIFAGLDVAAVFAVTGAIVAEFVGSTEGLGYVIQATNFTLDVSRTFAVLVMLSVIGLTLHFVVVLVGRRVVFWSHDVNRLDH